jgi:PKD domain
MKAATALCIGALLCAGSGYGFEKPDTTLQIFQFPADQIPRIDGNDDDWAIVPESYVVGIDQMTDDSKKHTRPDPKQIDARVRVGWVKGLNRLYFFYEATQRYWDFALPGLHNDTFEVVVDGDASGGPLIDKQHKEFWTSEEVGAVAAAPDPRVSDAEAHWAIHGVQAQNYHIFTPALNKDWAMAWGSPAWIKDFPWANAAYSYSFKPGESGKLKLEFWITLFDYAGPEGPARAVESVLRENKLIGLAWAIIDYSDVNSKGNDGFWNLSPRHTMYGNASALLGFRLMPLEPRFQKPIEAKWSHKVVDMERRLVAFKDESVGKIETWHWDFGDGSSSAEQFPEHLYRAPGNYVVVLDVTGPAGTSRYSRVWDVQLR